MRNAFLAAGVVLAALVPVASSVRAAEPAAAAKAAEELERAKVFERAKALRTDRYVVTAAAEYAAVLKGGKSEPRAAEALQALVELREELADDAYVQTLLAQGEAVPAPSLPQRAAEQLQYLKGVAAQREGKLPQAIAFLEAVTPTAPVYAKARYLLAVVRADPRLPGGARADLALAHFDEVLAIRDRTQEELERIQGLARLGIGRVRYAQGEYVLASKAYETVPRFTRFWPEALLENAFARFRRGDLGGALGSLETLNAPQFEGAFQPEAWILKASIFYFSCLADEAHAAVEAFTQQYGPLLKSLEPWVTAASGAKRPLREYLVLVEEGASPLPRGLRRWIRQNETVSATARLRARLSKEIADGRLVEYAPAAIERAEEALTQLQGRAIQARVEDAHRELTRLSDQADVVEVETAKVDKELVQAGVDQRALLGRQKLGRPGMPVQGNEYWRFDGEYWLDELGYYQYTLKDGCPPKTEAKAKAEEKPTPRK